MYSPDGDLNATTSVGLTDVIGVTSITSDRSSTLLTPDTSPYAVGGTIGGLIMIIAVVIAVVIIIHLAVKKGQKSSLKMENSSNSQTVIYNNIMCHGKQKMSTKGDV